MDDVLRAAAEDAARIAVLPRRDKPHDTPALRQANVAATAECSLQGKCGLQGQGGLQGECRRHG